MVTVEVVRVKIINILKLLFGIRRPSNVYSDVMRHYDLDAVKRFTKIAQGGDVRLEQTELDAARAIIQRWYEFITSEWGDLEETDDERDKLLAVISESEKRLTTTRIP